MRILHRICPGMSFAMNSVFIGIATMLYVFDITKSKDDSGEEIVPEVDFQGFIRYVAPDFMQLGRRLHGLRLLATRSRSSARSHRGRRRLLHLSERRWDRHDYTVHGAATAGLSTVIHPFHLGVVPRLSSLAELHVQVVYIFRSSVALHTDAYAPICRSNNHATKIRSFTANPFPPRPTFAQHPPTTLSSEAARIHVPMP